MIDLSANALVRRIEDKVARIPFSGCWVWMGAATADGYGRIVINGTQILTHRLSYELHKGPVPAGLLVCHHCDTPACINPHHLFVGTHQANMSDASRKGRLVGRQRIPRKPRARIRKTKCPLGHELTAENLYVYGEKWMCRACTQQRYRDRYRAKIKGSGREVRSYAKTTMAAA